jgi:hypothetical protein
VAISGAAAAHGQELSISAQVNKTQVALDDQVVLAVTVTGPQASLPDPQLPALQNFSQYSSGRNQSISFVNGRVSSSVTHTFVLVPRALGQGVISPISVAVGNSRAQTEPIEIQVVRSQAPPPGAEPVQPAPAAPPAGAAPGQAGRAPAVMITAELDKRKVFVNEQAILTVRFYSSVPLLGNPEYVPPKLEGVLTEDLPPLRNYNANFKGRTYGVTEIKTALFPMQTGRRTIGAATVRCQLQQDMALDPFSQDFFDRFFSQGLNPAQTKTIASQPLQLEVAALPVAGRPADFSGGVGRFTLSANVDKARSQVGDAVNLTVTVQGAGNLKALGNPALPELPSWRVFDPVASVSQEKKGDTVSGSKVIRIVLVPRVSGELAIPPITMSYFDPGRQEYVRIHTAALTVSVAPGDPNAAPAVGYTAPSAPAAKGLTRVNEDVIYLKVRPALPAATRWLEAVAGAGPLHSLPFLFFFWVSGLALYRGRLAADPQGVRYRAALRAALKQLQVAQLENDPQKAVALMNDALYGYLADKLGEPAAGLTMRRVQELLRKRQPHLPDPVIACIKDIWEELDSRRFAPPAGDAADGLDELRRRMAALLPDLDQEFKR